MQTKDLDFAWGDEPFVQDLSTTIMRGDRVGIVGPNGSGKTTLLQLLLGELEPAQGTVRLGVNLEVAYFDQLHACSTTTRPRPTTSTTAGRRSR